MKHTFKTQKGMFTLVELPPGATKPEKGLFPSCLWYRDDFGYQVTDFETPLKKEDTIVGFVKDLPEEVWADILDCYGENRWHNYLVGSEYLEHLHSTALESANSLIAHLKIDLNENWLLVSNGS